MSRHTHTPESLRRDCQQLIKKILAMTDETLDTATSGRMFEELRYFDYSLKDWFPKWYLPLLTSPQGHRILSHFDEHFVRGLGDKLDPDDFMHFCLGVQIAVQTEPTDKLKVSLEAFAKMPLKQVCKAIVHYIHPDQAGALAQLIAAMPIPPPAMPQFNVPLDQLPLLFPTLDTSQIAPQFDWLMYFITQYSPTNKDDYSKKLISVLDEMAPTSPLTLKPGVSLDKVFVHNHLLNSYEEYLAHKLPEITPNTQQQPLFPYFSNPHPILRPAASNLHPIFRPVDSNPHPIVDSKDHLTSLLQTLPDDFMQYLRLLFILGPSISSPAGIPLIIPDPALATFSHLRIQVFNYQYRVWLRQHNQLDDSTTTTTTTTTTSITSSPVPTPSPPEFTANPLGLFQLTLLPLCSRAPNLALHAHEHLPARFKTTIPQLFLFNQSHFQFLFLIIDHCFSDSATRDELSTGIVDFLLHHPSAVDTKIKFSHILYQQGRPTLHQLAYRKLVHNVQHSINTPSNALIIDFFKSALLQYDTPEQFALLTTHVTLCVHAGLLAPPPLPSTTTTTDPTTPHSPQSAILFHTYLTLRVLLYAVLLRLTGLIMYFPGSTQLLGNAICAIRFILTFRDDNITVTSQRAFAPRDIPLLLPHSIPDPCDEVPNLQATLVDDDGELFAVKYGPALNMQQQYTPWWAAHFPSQSGPRHKHLLHGAAIDDFRVGIEWGQHQIEQQDGLDVGTNCNPYDRPRIPAADLAWIESRENRDNMSLEKTYGLRKKLTAYYRKVKAVETDMVVTQMQKVLRKADQVGLFDSPPTQNAQPKSYPLPDFPSLKIVFGKYSQPNEDITKVRGELHWCQHQNYFYDHNYRPTSVYLGDKSPQDRFKAMQSRTANYHDCNQDEDEDEDDEEVGRMTDADLALMRNYFRQRSEWAIELLIVGCLGLQSYASSQPQPTSPDLAVPTPTPAPADPNTRFQHCKEYALQHFPSILGELQPTPTNLPRSPNLTRLTYFHDMLAHFNLLATLPLYTTLVTLPHAQSQ